VIAAAAQAGVRGEGRSVRLVVLGGFAPSLIRFRGPLLATMVGRGHEVIAMAAEADADVRDRLAALGVRFESLPLDRAGIDPWRDGQTVIRLAARLRALAPELVFSYTVKPNVYGGLAAQLTGVPRRFAMVTGLGYAFLGQERLRRRLLAGLVARLYRAGLRGVDGVFFHNPDDRAELERLGVLPAAARRLEIAGSGVDLAHFAPSRLPPGPPRFLFVGRFLREKGFVDFVAAARKVRAQRPDARFAALGWIDPNPASVSAEALRRWSADGVVDHLGAVDDVRPILAAHPVLVLPSYREGTPRSVLEAMATARPAIVTDVPGCRETIVDGDSGLLVPARDPDALAAACLRLFDDPAAIARMGGRARARAEARFDAWAIAAGMADEMGL
jgi:glycosyltransferase involved in cell wall biosynthesis